MLTLLRPTDDYGHADPEAPEEEPAVETVEEEQPTPEAASRSRIRLPKLSKRAVIALVMLAL